MKNKCFTVVLYPKITLTDKDFPASISPNKLFDSFIKHSFPFNPFALRMAKTPLSFGHSECNRVKNNPENLDLPCKTDPDFRSYNKKYSKCHFP